MFIDANGYSAVRVVDGFAALRQRQDGHRAILRRAIGDAANQQDRSELVVAAELDHRHG